jgi:hypothetical protein
VVSPALTVVVVAQHVPLLLRLGKLFRKDSVLTAQGFVLLLQAFRDVLERDIALDLTLLV